MNMNVIRWALALLVVCVTMSFVSADDTQKPIKVLLIGNSQCPTIANNQLIEKLAASDQGGRPIKVGGCIKGGASLRSHWEAGTGEGSARAMIASKAWDFVVLQDIYNVQEPAFQPYARQFHALIKESGSKTVLFGTASILSDYPKGFERQHGLHVAMGKELGVPVVDASYAYIRYFGDKPSTERLESLFAKDRAHPGLSGSYIYSCMIYSAITERSPIGLSAPDAIPADVAKTLQETAWAQHQETVAALGKPQANSATTSADLVITGGRVVTLDAQNRIVDGIALKAGRIAATGSVDDMQKWIGPQTEVIKLAGQSVLPGFIESHCHAVGAARGSLEQTYVEISSIAEMQDWIRREAKDLPAGRWIEVPRNEITRLKERRFPTPTELDAACTTHPVLYNSVSNKYVLNTVGFERLGLLKPDSKLEGGEVLRDESGKPILIRGGAAAIRAQMPARPTFSNDEVREALAKLLKRYNEVGITSIFERATDPQSLAFFRELKTQERLTTRVTGTFRFSAKSAEAVEKYVASLGLKPGDGDEWIKPGPLKITVDGGIHWATTRLTEPYGSKRIEFYRLTDPEYRGEQYYSVAEMQAIFAAATKLGWQMSAHVTGDEGTLRVLEAVAKAAETEASIRSRRFTLIHSYFPSPEIVKQCRDLGVGVDTQGYLYFKDADTLAEIYGPQWAERFLGLGDWVRGGVPVGLNADHMIGFDPDHAMNSFNPLLMISIAVTRKTLNGHVHGAHQKLSRLDAIRTVTQWPAWLSFDEQKLGSLEVGKLADVVILDRDLLTCPEDTIAQTKVRRTIVGGKTVFTATAGKN